jgi:DeoR family transcriptional regulator, suf operon transcriptional repressor
LAIKPDGNNEIEMSMDTKRMILIMLHDGPISIGEIANRLKIQKSAIRTHLESLRAEQTIKSYFRMEGLGRPKKIYEITDKGRELFPRKYDLILSLVLQCLELNEGSDYVKKITMAVADNIAQEIREKISSHPPNLEDSIRILNLASNEMGFMSSTCKEDDNTYSIISKNCIVHKVASSHQDAICHGLHNRIIEKALDGKIKPKVELKDCIALGDSYCRHIISIEKRQR